MTVWKYLKDAELKVYHMKQGWWMSRDRTSKLTAESEK